MSYADNVALAQRLINSKGRDVTLEQLSAAPDNAAKPWLPGTGGVPTVLTSFAVKAVFVPHTGFDSLGKQFVDVELLKRCEQLLLVAGQASDLSVCHRVDDSSSKWRIVWIKELKPGDTTILYAMGVAR